MGDGSSSSSIVAMSLMNSASNARIGMHREVYEAAENGSVVVLQQHNNWKQEKTARQNNVLHVHLGKPLKKNCRGVVTDHVCMSFIQYVVDETTDDSLLLHSNDSGDTPLHFAARFGHTDAVKVFLARAKVVSARLLNKANKCKDTALHDAARAGHANIVMMLVEAGSENALHYMPNNLQETPHFLAAERGCFKSFNSIVEHTADLTVLDHKGPCGQTALHLAVQYGYKDIVDRILEIETSSLLIRVKNHQGETPLHACAAQNDKVQHTIMRALLDHDDEYNSAVYIKDNEGRTALHIATQNLNFDGAQKLVRYYPDCIEMVDNKGRNVVHFVANLGSLKSITKLLRKVPKCDRLINEKDNEGNTPLHLLLANSHTLFITNFFYNLPMFVWRNKNLDVRVFNGKNLTAGNIMASGNHPAKFNLRTLSKLLPEGKRLPNTFEGGESADTIGNVENGGESADTIGNVENNERLNHLRRVGETQLIVAALIATVSFTAGFTLPGGFDQSPGKTMGLAVLVKKASFIAFLVSDTIAFTMSSLAIILYFAASVVNHVWHAKRMLTHAHLFSSISLGALMIAFLTGVYAVVSQSPGLGLIIIFISLFYFLPYFFLLMGSFWLTWNLYTGGWGEM
ncbi:hypothetical protein RND81_14G211700 [Saponaria officinalis]|uniref:PGG domain-containing protein n=1 Tax=Saponaria officinalis TaxID=3572 RepID=A0AAW1GSA4_SAPOF